MHILLAGYCRIRLKILVLLLLSFAFGAGQPLAESAEVGTITTYVGGEIGIGPAITLAQRPTGIAVSGTYLYIADITFNVVRRLDITTGFEVVVAGNGITGFSGDNGPATSAQLTWPSSVEVDKTGNLYITGNNRVRTVDISGIITTVAGNSTPGYSGDNGPATFAQLNSPDSVVVDVAGNLYITDGGNNRIRKVDTSGIITTVAGNGTQGFSGDNSLATSSHLNLPMDVAVDGFGYLYIADADNSRIRREDPSGIITTIAGNGAYGYSGDEGPATNAQLSWPDGLVVDGFHNLFIADEMRIRLVKMQPESPPTITGNAVMEGRTQYNGITVTLEGTDSLAGTTYTATTANDGLFTISNLEQGNYILIASYPSFLKAGQNVNIVAGSTIDVGTLSLSTGDLDGNNRLDLADLMVFSQVYPFAQGNEGGNHVADLNADGRVDVFDLVHLTRNFGRVGYVKPTSN